MRFAKISYGNHNQVGLIDKEIQSLFYYHPSTIPLSVSELKDSKVKGTPI
jgi:hypothetical protein